MYSTFRRLSTSRIYKTLRSHSTPEDKLYNAKGDDFHLAVARTLEEACKLLGVGFENVTDVDMVKPFMKRK